MRKYLERLIKTCLDSALDAIRGLIQLASDYQISTYYKLLNINYKVLDINFPRRKFDAN